VPFEEDAKDSSIWFLDHNFLESMEQMFKKVNSKEKVVGWYSTGPKIKTSDIDIHEIFRKYLQVFFFNFLASSLCNYRCKTERNRNTNRSLHIYKRKRRCKIIIII
jgi:26S proteasome regulatory subunit N8